MTNPTSRQLIKRMIKLNGWDGMYEIYINQPHYANKYNLATDEYISNVYTTESGDIGWHFYATLYAEWFPYKSKNKDVVIDLINLDDVHKYAKLWNLIDMHGGIEESEDIVSRAYVYDSAFFSLKEAIKDYHDINS